MGSVTGVADGLERERARRCRIASRQAPTWVGGDVLCGSQPAGDRALGDVESLASKHLNWRFICSRVRVGRRKFRSRAVGSVG